MNDYRLGLYEKSMPNSLPLREKLRAAREAGFDCMEISIDETQEKLNRLSWPRQERAAIRCGMEEEGLIKGVDYAAARGVVLGFETMETPFMDTISKAMAYVDLIASPYLGVYPDLGNLTNACRLYGKTVPEELLSGAGRLFAMHLKETEEGKYRDMRFGSGKVDFTEGIRIARQLGVRLFVAECWQDCDDWQTVNRGVNRFIRKNLSRSADAIPTLTAETRKGPANP